MLKWQLHALKNELNKLVMTQIFHDHWHNTIGVTPKYWNETVAHNRAVFATAVYQVGYDVSRFKTHKATVQSTACAYQMNSSNPFDFQVNELLKQCSQHIYIYSGSSVVKVSPLINWTWFLLADYILSAVCFTRLGSVSICGSR